MKIKPLSGSLAAEISGVNLTASSTEELRLIHQALLQHIVLVFRDQSLTPAEQVAFTEYFGSAEPHPLNSRRSLDDWPQVLVLENRPQKPGARNDFWHSDISHAERPPALSILHALQVPQGYGDTQFCNMYAAYQRLSKNLRDTLDNLQAWHSAEATAKRNREQANDGLEILEIPPAVAHPVVRTHPESGRKALYVNPFFTQSFVGMSINESQPMLNYLYRHATVLEHIYRHRWQPGDVLVWDNRCAMHYAVKDYDETMRRLMRRTTAAGDRPV